jgi:acetylornithine deacetylase/succinyl-diaminopimelate desuccinylase-like protein
MRIATALLALVAPTTILAQRASGSVRDWRATNEVAIVREMNALLALPNITRDTSALRRNATAIAALMQRRGIATRLLETPGGPPVVYGELKAAKATRTIVLYAHYDGQPVNASEWQGGAPFTPAFRVQRDGKWVDTPLPDSGRLDPEGRVFARGSGDDKAPIIAILAALDALKATGGSPSVNLKFFFEGEEESGSEHLEQMLRTHATLLASDGWIFCDSPVHASRQLQVVLGVRGSMGLELTVYGPSRALHSGHYGNWAPNPGILVAELVTSLRDADGRILVKGFQDDVTPPTPKEIAAARALPRPDSALREELLLGGTEANDALLAERLLLPGLNVRGIRAGNVEGAAANAIATDAKASIDFRLVPKQTPERIRELVEAHLTANGWYVTHNAATDQERLTHRKVVRLVWGGGDAATRVSADSPLATALLGAMDEMLGKPILRVPTMGGSLPTAVFEQTLGVPLIVFPIANHDDNQHAKDENIRLQNLWDGIDAFAAMFTRLDRFWPRTMP